PLARLAVPAALLEAAFDLAPFGMALLGDSGEILLANPAFARLLGTEQTDLTGTSLASLASPPAHARLTVTPITADPQTGMAAARRGSVMVRKLLGFSRRERLTLQAVKLSSLLNDLSRKFRDVFPASVELEITTEHTPEIRADPRAIEEILMNLLTNARDALP